MNTICPDCLAPIERTSMNHMRKRCPDCAASHLRQHDRERSKVYRANNGKPHHAVGSYGEPIKQRVSQSPERMTAMQQEAQRIASMFGWEALDMLATPTDHDGRWVNRNNPPIGSLQPTNVVHL